MLNSPVLALLYVLAQAVERIVELLSEFKIWGDPDSTDPSIKRHRTIWLWILASAFGIAVCSVFSVNFVQMLTASVRHPYLSVLLSGIIVGSGSKPVHDLITVLEKYAVIKNNDAQRSSG